MTSSSTPSPKRLRPIIEILPPDQSTTSTSSIHPDDQFEVDFIRATLAWVNDFPVSTPLTLDNIKKPTVLYQLFKVILPDEDFTNTDLINTDKEVMLFKSDTTKQQQDDGWSESNKVIRQSLYLEQVFKNHIKRYFSKVSKVIVDDDELLEIKRLPFPVEQLNWIKLCVYNDHSQLFKFCQLLVYVSTFTASISGISSVYLQFIDEKDAKLLTKWIKSLDKQSNDENDDYDYDDIEDSIRMKSFKLKRSYKSDPVSPHSIPLKVMLNQNINTETRKITVLEVDYNALKWENTVFAKALFSSKPK